MIVGGGIYGACLAWEGVLCGLSVALIDKGDFGSATSANSLKVIHGGLRYLQTADFTRLRQSSGERRNLMKIAPHLVHPLPVVMPTFGTGIKSRLAFNMAFRLNNALTLDRNDQMPAQKRIPPAHLISPDEYRKRLPNFDHDRLTGGAVFYDAQVYNTERLTLAFLRSAANAGAEIANYVRAADFLREGDAVVGVRAVDRLDDCEFEIRAGLVVNAAGPWTAVLERLLVGSEPTAGYVKAVNIITRKVSDTAVGFPAQRGGRGGRYYFAVPWRDHSLIGTAYLRHGSSAPRAQQSVADVENFVEELNAALPALKLTRHDVSFVHAGLLPAAAGASDVTALSRRPRIMDHRRNGIHGVISVEGVKYTTARLIAQKTINYIFSAILQRQPPRSVSAVTALYGGEFEDFDGLLENACKLQRHGLQRETLRRLILNYGTAYIRVLDYLETGAVDPAVEDEAVIAAQVRYGVRHEMAQRLSDIMLRRTEVGSAGRPSPEHFMLCADVMAREMGWSFNRREQEMQDIDARYSWMRVDA